MKSTLLGLIRRFVDSDLGTVSVEAAMTTVFLLGPLAVGGIDFGQVLHAKYIVARGAEQSVMAAATGGDPLAVAQTYLRDAGLDPGKLTLTVTSGYATAAMGTDVSARLDYSLAGSTIINWDGVSPPLSSVSATAVTRHQ